MQCGYNCTSLRHINIRAKTSSIITTIWECHRLNQDKLYHWLCQAKPYHLGILDIGICDISIWGIRDSSPITHIRDVINTQHHLSSWATLSSQQVDTVKAKVSFISLSLCLSQEYHSSIPIDSVISARKDRLQVELKNVCLDHPRDLSPILTHLLEKKVGTSPSSLYKSRLLDRSSSHSRQSLLD